MRSTIVPAQITTIEDKIVGNLGLSQLFLLSIPVFSSPIIYMVCPPFSRFAFHKLLFLVITSTLFATLAIRIKGKLILFWLVILLRFQSRPQFYVFDKNSACLRDSNSHGSGLGDFAAPSTVDEQMFVAPPQLSIAEIVKLEGLLADPKTNVSFQVTNKGGLDVSIAEIE